MSTKSAKKRRSVAELVSVADAEKRAGLSSSGFRAARLALPLRSYRAGRSVFFDPDELDAWIERRRTPIAVAQ